jgi:DNA-binding IclR family transcriptional regulator
MTFALDPRFGPVLTCDIRSSKPGIANLSRHALNQATGDGSPMAKQARTASSPSARGARDRRVKVVDDGRRSSDNPLTTESSLDRVFDALNLFSVAKPLWTVDEATAALKHSRSTVYRYIRALVKAGLLVSVGRAYGLGPRIVELDQQMRLTDPLLRVAQPQLAQLRRRLNAVVLLMRLFHDRIICIHEEWDERTGVPAAGRGRAVTFFRGATSKVILAHLPTRRLKSLYLNHARDIAKAGLGSSWNAFVGNLRDVRRRGYHISEVGELITDVFSIAVPIFSDDRKIIGSLTVLQREIGKSSRSDELRLAVVRKTARDLSRAYVAIESGLRPDLNARRQKLARQVAKPL